MVGGRCVASVLGVLAVSSVSVLGGAAMAADMKPLLKAPPSYAYGTYNWTGWYAGASIGAAHGIWTVDFFRNNNHGHAEEGADGVAFAGYGGYNYQFMGNWVVGAEADLGFTTAKQRNNIFDNDTSLAKYGLTGSVRARFGYAIDRLLFYSTIGLGFVDVSNEIQKGRNAGEQVVWDNQFRTGLAVGGGIEYAFTNRWVGRVEYLFTDLGHVTLFNADGNRAEFKNELHLFRVGASYRF